MKRFAVLASLITLFAVSACSDRPDVLAPDGPQFGVTSVGPIKVLSQNMYLGANIDLLLTADDPTDVGMVFQQLRISTQSGMFKRAQQMAQQIAFQAPHLVGLQEVTKYVMGGQTLDFLYVLQQYLNYFHATYQTPLYTAIRNDNTTVEFAASVFNPAFPDVEYTDGDAILVRQGVTVDGSPVTKQYDAYETFSVAGTSFANRRGYLAIKATVAGQTFWFANTHLEVQAFASTQVAQAAELIEAFEDETLPVIMVGDFNSAANNDAAPAQKTDSYHMFRNAGYADIWLREPHSVTGYTCCQNATLTNADPELDQRLDLILVRWGKAGFGGKTSMDILGEASGDRITFEDPELGSLTLWPSDHAGVVGQLWPAPGRLQK